MRSWRLFGNSCKSTDMHAQVYMISRYVQVCIHMYMYNKEPITLYVYNTCRCVCACVHVCVPACVCACVGVCIVVWGSGKCVDFGMLLSTKQAYKHPSVLGTVSTDHLVRHGTCMPECVPLHLSSHLHEHHCGYAILFFVVSWCVCNGCGYVVSYSWSSGKHPGCV